MISEKNIEPFRQWLVNDKSLKYRSAKDVISRVKRLIKMGLDEESIKSKNLENIYECNDFCDLSMTVKSQLKRAANLYFEYLNIKKNRS